MRDVIEKEDVDAAIKTLGEFYNKNHHGFEKPVQNAFEIAFRGMKLFSSSFSIFENEGEK